MNLLIEKGRDFNLENHLKIFDYVKACDKIKTDKLFDTLQSEYIPNLLLKNKESCCGNKIRINNKLSDE